MARPHDSKQLARVRRSGIELWGLSLLLCLSGCGNASSEAPRAAAPVTATHAPETLNNSSSTTGSLGAPSPSRTPSQPSPSEPPTAVVPVRADLSGPVSSAAQAADQAAWAQWYEAARESPDVTVRLQALEQWAQRPGDALDPVTYGLVDQDEAVRTRAQQLYEQTLTREATEPVPSSQSGAQEPPAEP